MTITWAGKMTKPSIARISLQTSIAIGQTMAIVRVRGRSSNWSRDKSYSGGWGVFSFNTSRDKLGLKVVGQTSTMTILLRQETSTIPLRKEPGTILLGQEPSNIGVLRVCRGVSITQGRGYDDK